MKKNSFKTTFGDNITAEKFIRSALRGEDYERGSLEATEAEARNVLNALACLVHILYDRNIISADDVESIALSHYGYDI